MLDIIRVPIGYLISWCYKLIPSYAVALLLFALIMKIILFPLSIGQQKKMVKQASLRPKEQAIRNRYAGRTDKVTQQKMQQEILDLYQKENFNPASGCLPMILQLVIVFALFGVIMNPLHYINHLSADNVNNIAVHAAVLYKDGELTTEKVSSNTKKALEKMAENVGDDGKTDDVKNTITGVELVTLVRENGVDNFKDGDNMLPADYSKDDLPKFTVFGDKFDLAKTPSISDFGWLWLIPLLTFVFTFGSMKLTRKFSYTPEQPTGDAAVSMKMMDFSMPLISTFFTFTVPAVIAVYWIYQNVLSTLQQYVLKLMYPYPTYTEEEYKQAEREMNKGVKQYNSKKEKKNNGGKIAAHRIDLDEPEQPAQPEEKAYKVNGKKLVPPAALKDESDKPDDFSDTDKND